MNHADQFVEEDKDGNVFKQLINRYMPFWPLFVISVGIAMVVAYIMLRSEEPEYIATSRVLLKDPSRGSSDESRILEDLNIFSKRKVLDNEIVTLRSTELMWKAVKDLDLYASVFNKGNVRTEELYGSNAPVKFVALDKDKFNLNKTLYFTMDWGNNEIIIDDNRTSFQDTLRINGNLFRIVVNPEYNKNAEGKNFFVTFSNPRSVARALVGKLGISPYSATSTILDVTLSTTVPAKANPLLLKLFEIYNFEAARDKNYVADRTINFIDERLALVTLQLDSVERNISKYQSSTDVIDLGTQASSYFSMVSGLDNQKAQLDLQLDALNDVKKYVTRKADEPGTVPALMIINNSMLSALLSKLYDAELKVAELRGVTGERNDAFILANQDVSRIKEDILENMGNIREELLLSRRNIDSRITQFNSMLHTIPEKERMFLDISRQQSVKNSIYTFLLQKKEETAIASVATTPDLKIIEPPTSRGPVKPIPKKFYLTGLLIGLMAAAAIILLMEILNKRVLFRSEIESKVKAPIIGELIQAPNRKESIVIGDGNRSIIAEQFRTIRTNLSFMGLRGDRSVLLVTSSISGEGKSFVAINLAISISLTGKRVALVEMDLRKPKLSKVMGVSRRIGVSSYLVDKAGIADIIRETSYPDLFIIPAGPIPPNPTELISEAKFDTLMKEIRERFDYVILDTAPVSPVTDSQLLEKYSDVNMFIIRHRVTPKAFLQNLEGLRKQKKFSNMCIIFNGIKPRGMRVLGYTFGGYGNGYGSGYGYGYDYGDKYSGGYYGAEKKSLKERLRDLFRRG